MNDIQKLKEAIILSASYFRQTISPAILEMYVDDLIDLPIDAVIESYKTYRRNQKNRTMPLPAQIRDIVQPEKTTESDARDSAARIQQAIVNFGHSNAKDARTFLGESVWSVINSFGGWNFICTNHGVSIDPAAFYAQTRERLNDVGRELRSTRHLSIAAPVAGEVTEQSNIDAERLRQITELLKQGG